MLPSDDMEPARCSVSIYTSPRLGKSAGCLGCARAELAPEVKPKVLWSRGGHGLKDMDIKFHIVYWANETIPLLMVEVRPRDQDLTASRDAIMGSSEILCKTKIAVNGKTKRKSIFIFSNAMKKMKISPGNSLP